MVRAFAVVFFLGSLMACQMDTDPYPKGTIEVATTKQFLAPSGNIVSVTYSVKNTGTTPITKTTASFKLTTSSQADYYQSDVCPLTIEPDGTVYATMLVQIIDLADTVETDSVVVVSSFCE